MKKQRFSLIELLVIIAVITILASLLLPALNAAKLKAQSMICLGNLRTHSTGLIAYTLENGDFFPQDPFYFYSNGKNRPAAYTANSYKPFICPNDNIKRKWTARTISYSLNGYLDGSVRKASVTASPAWPSASARTAWKITAVRRPSGCVSFCEYWWDQGVFDFANKWIGTTRPNGGSWQTDTQSGRILHQLGSLYSFVDGSAKYIADSAFMTHLLNSKTSTSDNDLFYPGQ